MHTIDVFANSGSEMPEGAELEKYISLIHILKGQEEFLLDKNGVIISSNLEAVNITGYEEYEVLGKHISFLYMPEECEKAHLDLQKADNVGQTFVTGLKVKKRGASFWAKMNIKRLSAADPLNPRFKVTLQDVTHRALSNLRIQTIKDEYLAIFNNPFVGAFKFRMKDYKIMMCNQKMLEITGTKDSTDLYFNEFFHDKEQFTQFIALLSAEKRLEGFKFLIQDDKNREDNWAVISVRYFEAQGFAEGVLVDISEQHSQMVELQRLNAELDKFTYHASHDLRAPLTTMLGLVNLGLGETSIETVHTYFKMIQGQISHLDTVLKDLISVSYNNKAQPEYEVVNFAHEARSIINSLEYPGHPFKIEIDIKEDHGFATDPVRLRAILRNVLSNAFKYYNPKIEAPYIKLIARINAEEASVVIEDNGIGIDQNYKDRIYNMFFRGTTQSSGTGLGLYIVKSMTDKLNGHISFDSALNEGTKFYLTIPNRVDVVGDNAGSNV